MSVERSFPKEGRARGRRLRAGGRVAALPANSLVLTHNPNMFLLWGISAAQASIAASEPEYVRAVYLPRYRGGVYFHWNFWCNVNDPVQRQFCVNVLDGYDTEKVETRRVRDQEFVFYRLEGMR